MRAVVYARVSSMYDRQSTDRQVADLMAYAEFSRLEVINVFEEKISGAKRNSERPILIEALEFCRKEHVDMLLVSELSRLGRNAFEVLETVKGLVDDKINLYLQKEKITLLDEDRQPSLFAPIMMNSFSVVNQGKGMGTEIVAQSLD